VRLPVEGEVIDFEAMEIYIDVLKSHQISLLENFYPLIVNATTWLLIEKISKIKTPYPKG
jgi:hypothetical protein